MKNKSLFVVVGLGLFIRILYATFFSNYAAQVCAGQTTAYVNASDFELWTQTLKNFFSTGEYSYDINHPDGYYARMPGYAVFIAVFYFLPGENTYLYAIVVAQIILDSIVIFLIWKIALVCFNNSKISLLAAFLYSVHPLNIIWSGLLFSESLSVFLLVWGIYIQCCSTHRYKDFFAGIIIGFDVLVRPQIAVFIAVFLCFHFVRWALKRDKQKFRILTFFLVGFLISYGWWPVRNFILSGKLIPTQDISAIPVWADDVQAYMRYIYSVQPNWEPQFTQLIRNKPFEVDKENAYKTPGDSLLLTQTLDLARNVGSGFSSWPGYWKKPLAPNKYDTIIVQNFDLLRAHQIQYNPFNYWVRLPLKNMKRCLFKTTVVTKIDPLKQYLVAIMYGYRSLLLLLGIAGSLLIIRKKNAPEYISVAFVFFIVWYVLICAGDTAQLRNIEMRYLLQTDSLLLIPAAYSIVKGASFLKIRKDNIEVPQ